LAAEVAGLGRKGFLTWARRSGVEESCIAALERKTGQQAAEIDFGCDPLAAYLFLYNQAFTLPP